jgi:hypothetical protein
MLLIDYAQHEREPVWFGCVVVTCLFCAVGLGYVNNCLPRKLRDAFLAEAGYIFRSRFLSTQRSPSLVDFLDLT